MASARGMLRAATSAVRSECPVSKPTAHLDVAGQVFVSAVSVNPSSTAGHCGLGSHFWVFPALDRFVDSAWLGPACLARVPHSLAEGFTPPSDRSPLPVRLGRAFAWAAVGFSDWAFGVGC
eukprot:GGOE01002394.1.p1 GENE.GGOE01002394.1~~GGOE01002394.1.p1  ORF type:complete len:121 (+),score=2.75 GGOE01002394.1:282-644(+)